MFLGQSLLLTRGKVISAELFGPVPQPEMKEDINDKKIIIPVPAKRLQT